ncbi:exodeoxyribonuclease III [Nitrosomonas marina]|uniref:Exodeoxyribonuclease-3 n=1 Tax=Nitrosomonas marina TaxID=917 RepID=A0A1H8D830_9PROT|nr:exodeoxyribonuclease III [Nitrosomonas marina]SEN03460.1 exodeoxyribonuclease-3 [Nitrosomonas marina]
MQIITLNVNGVRAAARKGFYQWLPQQSADIVCIQELKAQLQDLSDDILAPDGYHGFFHCALKKGYSGVGIYSRFEPDRVVEGIGVEEIDQEGRYLQADFGNLSVISLYLPSGSSGDHRQASKFFFLDTFFPILQEMINSGRDIILCGDWNIAHKEIDLKNWRANKKNSGFLPEEREWLSRVFDEIGYVDVFRRLNPAPDQYTWWSNRGQAWANNVGWRIDYQIATPAVAGKAIEADIYKESRFSDHAPLIIRYDAL